MGPCLYISRRDGKFDIESLRKVLLSEGAAIELEDAPNEFVLVRDRENEIQLPIKTRARLNQENPAWNCPVVVLEPSRITVGVNWTDTTKGDLKACWKWVSNWLP